MVINGNKVNNFDNQDNKDRPLFGLQDDAAASGMKRDLLQDIVSIDHEQDLKARSVQPRMNLNQYRVKHFQSDMKVSQSCQTGP